MRFALCLALVLITVAVVSSEDCKTISDCNHLTCHAGTTIGCSHDICTCLQNHQNAPCPREKCAAKSDCDTCGCREDNNNNIDHHCFDGYCTCGFRQGGPGGPIGK